MHLYCYQICDYWTIIFRDVGMVLMSIILVWLTALRVNLTQGLSLKLTRFVRWSYQIENEKLLKFKIIK